MRELLGERVEFNAPLARHTSLLVGGPAEALARPETVEELIALVTACHTAGVSIQVLGKGFNTLVPDRGVAGVVVRLSELRELRREPDGHVFAGAGVTHSAITRFCSDRALSGLEFAVGIPGTVGGWIAMNAGIPEREMKDVVARVEFVTAEGELRRVPSAELAWHYRRLELPENAIVVAADFATQPGESEAIRAEMRRHLDYRRGTQPVNEPSCGSVFKNPPGERAGQLIEAVGLKGSRAGGAEISSLHANFIVNRGDATAAEVDALIERARAAVAERFGIELETEVRRLGAEEDA